MVNNELQVHIEEYKSTQEIINTRCQAEHNIHYWSILLLISSVSVSLGLFTRPEAQEYLYILLVLPSPFYLLSLMLLRNDIVISANAKYYYKILRPIVKKIIDSEKDIWMREKFITSTREGPFNKFLAACRYGTTLIAFPIYLIIYISLYENRWSFTIFAICLFSLNLLIELYIIYQIVTKIPEVAGDIIRY